MLFFFLIQVYLGGDDAIGFSKEKLGGEWVKQQNWRVENQ